MLCGVARSVVVGTIGVTIWQRHCARQALSIGNPMAQYQHWRPALELSLRRFGNRGSDRCYGLQRGGQVAESMLAR